MNPHADQTPPATPPGLIAARAAECLILFIAAPYLIACIIRPGLLFPAIWALAAICLVILWRDPSFSISCLWNARSAGRHLPLIFGLAAIGAALLTLILRLYQPDRLLNFPLHRPRLWAIIMVAYPILSVYPQEIAFRAFFFHRYAPLFGRGAAVVAASALAFGWAHVLLWNWWAIAFSAIGGVLFGVTYLRTRSLAASSLEHSLYGCFLFTIGWGQYFYAGGR